MKVPTIEVPADAADVLERAADLIEASGWCRASYIKGDKHCAVGAIAKAAGHSFEMPYTDGVDWEIIDFGGVIPYLDVVESSLRGRGALKGNEALHDWNDRQHDRRPVIAALRRTARSLSG